MDTGLGTLFLCIEVRGAAPAPEPSELKLARFRVMRLPLDPRTRSRPAHYQVPMRGQEH
jgi:hypothetical protein